MAPSSKNAVAAKDRRKSGNATIASTGSSTPVANDNSSKPTRIVTLNVPSKKLRAILDPDYVADNDNTLAKPSPAAGPNSGTENASDSAAPSPPASVMGPPDGPKKKGVKRNAAAAVNGNGEPKVRGKPGPKKKQRL